MSFRPASPLHQGRQACSYLRANLDEANCHRGASRSTTITLPWGLIAARQFFSTVPASSIVPIHKDTFDEDTRLLFPPVGTDSSMFPPVNRHPRSASSAGPTSFSRGNDLRTIKHHTFHRRIAGEDGASTIPWHHDHRRHRTKACILDKSYASMIATLAANSIARS